jgi:DNA-binding NarL/FixJ family response regulator
MIRILLADDHRVVRKGLRGTLEEYDGWQVCGEASDGRQAVELALKLKPDVAVLDLEMPELNGIEATRHIKEALPKVEVLIFTMHDTDEMILSAFEAGARAFVLKSNDELELVEAIKAISRHEPFVTTAASETVRDYLLRKSSRP